MAMMSLLLNLRIWVALALVVGFLMGGLGEFGPMIVIIALISMMTMSLTGLDLKKKDISENKKEMVLALVCCYIVAAGATLAVGMFFDGAIRHGWVLIASVPCAVSVVSATLVMKGNVKTALMSVTVIYVVALIATPALTKIMIGNAADPLEIMKYVILFILVPVLLSIPLKRLKTDPDGRNVVINICFFLLVAVAIGSNKERMFQDPVLVGWIILACVIRLVSVFMIMEWALSRFGVERDTRIVMILISVWKNSALAMTLAMLLISETEAALPAAILLPIETVWFIVMTHYYSKKCPPSSANKSTTVELNIPLS